MKTLYIISNGQDKVSDEEIKKLESENRYPRVTMLQNALSVDLLDERYLYSKPPKMRRWFYKRIPVAIAQIIEALILRKRYDVIFSHSEKAGLPLAMLLKILGIRIPHVMVLSRITSMNPKKSRQKMWFLKKAQSHIDRILIWSSVQRNIAIEKLGVPPSKLVLLKRGTDQKFWNPSFSKPADTICAVGMEMRDYSTLIEALSPLDIPCHIAVAHLRGITFKTVETIYEQDEIPANISVGRKNYEELRDLYARSRFVVVPLLETDSDNGLTAILEAMAMGKTVICSRVEGQVDVIREGVTGFFVPRGDPEALRKAILKLWNNPALAQEMGERARKYVEEIHNMEQFVDAIASEVKDAAGYKNQALDPVLKIEKVGE